MKRIIAIILIFLYLLITQMYAQDSVQCLYPNDSMSLYFRGSSCNDMQNYIPDISNNYQNTPIIIFRINFHFLRKMDGSGIYQDDQSDNVTEIIEHLNSFYKNIYYPEIEVSPPAEYIDDSRIRFEEHGIYYHYSDNDYESGVTCESDYYNIYGTDKETVFNIFFYKNDNYTNTNGCGPFPYVNMFNYFQNYANMQLIAHELGHVIGLSHTFSSCGDDGIDDTYFPDLNLDFYDCGINEPYYRQYCYPYYYTGITNNLMGYNKCRSYLSPKQLAIVQYNNITNANRRKYIKSEYDETNPDIYITANAVWESSKVITSNVIIDNNSELIVKCYIFLNPNSKIIVKPTSKLIIDGGQLTSLIHEPWSGIEVWGNSAEHQFPDANGNYKQGYLELKNGAVIENAQYAVRLWNSDAWNQMGGIVKADGATFRNNRKAAEFMSYQNYDPITHLPMPNQSYFTDCLFETTEEYNDIIPYPFEAFITVWKVEGVVFKGCFFKDVRDDFTFSSLNQSMGIYTIDASFSLLPYGAVRNRFEGLSIGVSSSQLETNNTYKIDKANFVNNQIGLRNSANNYSSCIRSNFKLGTKEVYPYYYFVVGLLNTASTGFTFEQNEFEKSVGFPVNHVFNAGMWNYNTGSSTNVIYKNTYTSLEIGNIASGDNRPINQVESGLYYKCNENNTNISFDFDIAPGLGIAANQGNRDKAAGNTFSHNASPAFSDFYNEATMPLNYYYYVNDYSQRPLNYSSNFTPFSTTSQNACAEHFPEGSGLFLDGNEIASLRAQYYDNKEEYNNTKTLYESLKDGGDTPGTISDIATSWPDETWALRAQLLANSPHLSSAVMMEAASRPDVLPNTILFEICMANPDEMRDARFLEFLATKENPMPQYMIDDLRDGADVETYKGVLQNEMTKYHSLSAEACNQIVRNILIDSTGIKYDTLRTWLTNTGTLEAAYQLVDSYLAQDDYTNASLALSAIPNDFELSDKENKEYNYFSDLKSTIISAHQQNRNVMQLDSLEVVDLVYIADSSRSVAGMQAQGLLNFAYGYNYFSLPVLPPTGEKSTRISDFGSKGNSSHSENYVKAHPNPASQWVAFDYNLPVPAEKGSLVVTDVSGKQIEIFNLRNVQGQTIWDTRNIPSGIYFLRLLVNGKSIDQQKIVISK